VSTRRVRRRQALFLESERLRRGRESRALGAQWLARCPVSDSRSRARHAPGNSRKTNPCVWCFVFGLSHSCQKARWPRDGFAGAVGASSTLCRLDGCGQVSRFRFPARSRPKRIEDLAAGPGVTCPLGEPAFRETLEHCESVSRGKQRFTRRAASAVSRTRGRAVRGLSREWLRWCGQEDGRAQPVRCVGQPFPMDSRQAQWGQRAASTCRARRRRATRVAKALPAAPGQVSRFGFLAGSPKRPRDGVRLKFGLACGFCRSVLWFDVLLALVWS
jgi:hypothetical protein